MPRYNPAVVEPKWQAYWEEHHTFRTPLDAPSGADKLYVLDMFPYPSGEGLHVGHPEGYTATDIVCRHARMNGKHVLHPMGWDAFGLPAEQHAMKTGTHPAETTKKNIDNFRRQLKRLGFSYDWEREVATADPDYFKWTQWIFLELYDTWYDPDHVWTGPDGVERTGKGRPIDDLPIPADVSAKGQEAVRRYQDEHRLAYQQEAPVNWCPALGTVLANEEVDANGLSERGSHPVERVPLRQWMLRITAYADRLESELEDLAWPDSIKALQRNWIGRSVGAEVDFFLGDSQKEATQLNEFNAWKSGRKATRFPAHPGDDVLRVYTTRPDTLYGATYMVLAPEHRLIDAITPASHRPMIDEYRREAARKSDLDRTDLAKEKTGVFTGAYAINPVNGRRVPVWIADYVLASYGTGAIMAVPAHDTRDFEFAATYDIPIKAVVKPIGKRTESKDEKAAAEAFPVKSRAGQADGFFGTLPFVGQGESINSGLLTGKPTDEAKAAVSEELSSAGLGRVATNYRLRDWLFSRQHYWGEPFPLWHELDKDGKPTGLLRTDNPEDLPVTLPADYDFQGHLAKKENGEASYDPPLADSPDSWLYATDPDGTRLMRETNSMPQWAGSCWYYLRYCDPTNGNRFVGADAEKYWMPVDLYVGGAEHAVLHLLYSRFWHKVLFDRGHVSTVEPFGRLINQGMILGEPETTGYRIASDPDPLSARVVELAAKHIDGIGGMSEDRSPDKLEDRVEWEDHLEDNGKTTLYAALRQALLHINDDKPDPKTVDTHPALNAVRAEIRRLESNADPNEPIRWWNNEKGVRPTRDMLAAVVSSLKSGTEQWVPADQIEDDPDSGGHRLAGAGTPVEAVALTADQVEKKGDKLFLKADPSVLVISRAHKMSKSRGNVINPDTVVDEYGADALRLYEMFMGPLEQTKPWSMSGVEGVARFLARVWRMVVDEHADDVTPNPDLTDDPCDEEQARVLHQTIKAVSADVEAMSFNTAISRMMEFTNHFASAKPRPKAALDPFVRLLAPFAPHLAEELWHVLGHTDSINAAPWPTYDESTLAVSEVEIPVQINGKVRGRLMVPADADEPTQQSLAESAPDIAPLLDGKDRIKTIVIPGRMVNFVVKG